MHNPLTPLLLFLPFLAPASSKKTPERVLLSNIKTLTLRKDLKTTANRVSPIPQLTCSGPGCQHYNIDVLRCRNAGPSYSEADVEWTCTASLPSEFKLGGTDVICEGFASSDDPYVLKGSCGVEYRLVLTELGEEKFGRGGDLWEGFGRNRGADWAATIFWVLFIAVVGWMIYSAFIRNRPGRPGANGGLGGWGDGWGGGGRGGGDDDPPPPYDPRPPPKPKTYTSPRAPRAAPARAQEQGWRPGFWTGALGGAAAGYMAGNRGQQQQPTRNQGGWGNQNQGLYGNGEGSSSWGAGRARSSGSSSSSSGYGSSRHESSGFGGTSRR